MALKRLPRPCDPIALAKLVGDIATGQVEDALDDRKDAAAAAMGRKGAAARSRRARGVVKDIVLKLLGDHTTEGLWTIDVVDLAKANGVDLDRNSVASLLSRLSRDGVPYL